MKIYAVVSKGMVGAFSSWEKACKFAHYRGFKVKKVDSLDEAIDFMEDESTLEQLIGLHLLESCLELDHPVFHKKT